MIFIFWLFGMERGNYVFLSGIMNIFILYLGLTPWTALRLMPHIPKEKKPRGSFSFFKTLTPFKPLASNGIASPRHPSTPHRCPFLPHNCCFPLTSISLILIYFPFCLSVLCLLQHFNGVCIYKPKKWENRKKKNRKEGEWWPVNGSEGRWGWWGGTMVLGVRDLNDVGFGNNNTDLGFFFILRNS